MRRNLLLAAVYVLAIRGHPAKGDYVWSTYGGHSYALTQQYGTWLEAEAEAVAAGGHLATVNDAAENAWLSGAFAHSYSLLQEGGPWGNIAWIGYYQDVDSQWKWASGEPVTYINYCSLFPQEGVHAYLHLAYHPWPSTWNAEDSHDDPLHQTTPFDPVRGIIEVVPEPATLLLLAVGGLRCCGGIVPGRIGCGRFGSRKQ